MIGQLGAYLAATRDEQLHELQEFLKQPSISTSPDHKKEMAACAKHVAEH
ncbi:hypothetical protein ACFSO0_19715 [Brevibacillus sp. GCM10020057]